MDTHRHTYAILRQRLPFIGLALGVAAAILLVYATGMVASKPWPIWLVLAATGAASWLYEPRSRAPDEPIQHEKLGFFGFLVGVGSAMLLAYTVFHL